MQLLVALTVEHDWIDAVNASSTVVIALFTVAMFFVVKYQLRASKDIERGWVMPKLERYQAGPLLMETTNNEGATTTAWFFLNLKNQGRSPVWVKSLQARMVLQEVVEQLPNKVELSADDTKNWYPPPFAEGGEEGTPLQLTTKGGAGSGCFVAYGKITYLDIFRRERFSTFGYVIFPAGKDGVKSSIHRLESHPEYNRNT